MRKLSTALLIYLGLASAALAQTSFPVPSQQVSIAGTVATITQIIPITTGKQIVVTAIQQVPVATSVVTYSYGTGTNCASGTTTLTGAMTFASGQVLNMGSGNGPILILPPGNALCITIATGAAPGSLVYTLVP